MEFDLLAVSSSEPRGCRSRPSLAVRMSAPPCGMLTRSTAHSAARVPVQSPGRVAEPLSCVAYTKHDRDRHVSCDAVRVHACRHVDMSVSTERAVQGPPPQLPAYQPIAVTITSDSRSRKGLRLVMTANRHIQNESKKAASDAATSDIGSRIDCFAHESIVYTGAIEDIRNERVQLAAIGKRMRGRDRGVIP